MNWLVLLPLAAALAAFPRAAQAQLEESSLSYDEQQEDAQVAVAEQEESEDESEAAAEARIKKRREARKRAAAEAAAAAAALNAYVLSSADGRVYYQPSGSSDWKVVDASEKRALKNTDIFKTEEKGTLSFAGPGKCAFQIEESSSLMLDGITKNPPSVTLVRGTLLMRCLPGQKLVVKNTLVRLENTGACAGMSYDFETGIAAAAKYAIAPSTAAPKSFGVVKAFRVDASSAAPDELEPGQQLITSKQTLDAQPGEIQSFFLDMKPQVTALVVPEPVRIQKSAVKRAKKKASEPAAPKLAVSRFESKREQDRKLTDEPSSASFTKLRKSP